MQIGFLGDTNFSGCYKDVDEAPTSKDVLEKLWAVDFLVANLEGPFLPAERLKYGSKPVGSPGAPARPIGALSRPDGRHGGRPLQGRRYEEEIPLTAEARASRLGA